MPSGYSKDGIPNGFQNRREKIKCICQLCKKIYYKHPYLKGKTRFCSRKCLGIGNKINLVGKYIGNQNSRWKGGNSRLYVKEQAIKLLGYNCQTCSSDKNVGTHHLDGNPLNNPKNGSNWRRLCAKCHMTIDGRIYMNIKPRTMFTCEICSKKFTQYQPHYEKKSQNKYCSQKCANSTHQRNLKGQFIS